jgi:hypothetical protein
MEYFKDDPWSGNYQSNINLQEIYWSCGPTDLAECQEAYTEWIENLAISGREIAQRVYGTAGWVSHTTGNIWGHAAPAGSHPWGMFPMGAVWHCQHIWDQFAFTQDTVYLRDKAFPLLREAAIFWLENLSRSRITQSPHLQFQQNMEHLLQRTASIRPIMITKVITIAIVFLEHTRISRCCGIYLPIHQMLQEL